MRLSLLGAGVDEVLDLAKLAVASYERRLQPLRLERAAEAGDHSPGLPERHLSFLAFQLERAGRLVHDRLLGRPAGRLADIDRAGLRLRLDARRGVDEIARDHALALGPERDRGFAGKHSRPSSQLLLADLLPERRDGRDQVERGADGALGVVLGGRWRSPDRHHGIPDELLDRSSVQRDDPPGGVEVAREELPHLLGVLVLGERREADEVGEQDGDEAPLRARRLALRRRRFRSPALERRAALAAEPLARLVLRSAGGARRGKGVPTFGAELPSLPVLAPAACADHRHPSFAVVFAFGNGRWRCRWLRLLLDRLQAVDAVTGLDERALRGPRVDRLAKPAHADVDGAVKRYPGQARA